MRPSDRHAPLIVRVAGLPAETMSPFSHPALADAIAERERLCKELGPLRASLVDCLHQAIHGAAKEERRFLLSMKRLCFNAENLSIHRRDPRWPLLAEVASTLVDAIVVREEAIAALDVTLEELYRRAIRQERECLARLIENRPFLRGVALASPVVAQNLDRLKRQDVDSYGRREKRLCLTLLRYASRAALKLSPLSTLTRTAIGRAMEHGDGFTLLPDSGWRERSTVSLHRELLGQCTHLLLRCRQFTENLPVEVNETLSCESDGRYRFFRPSRWVFDEATAAFRYDEASFVRIKLEGSLVPWLLAELGDGPRTFAELLAVQAGLDPAEREAWAQSLTELLGAGFLNPVMPWDSSAPDLEQQILEHLQELPEDAELSVFRDSLRELIGALFGYAAAGSPALFLGESKRAVEGLFHTLTAPSRLLPPVEFRAPANTFEEDVFLLPGPGSVGEDEIARLSADRMHDVLTDLDPLVRFANLHSSRLDLLLALAAFGDRLWPGEGEVELLELFGKAQPLFEEHVRYRGLHGTQRPPVFNPLGLERVAELSHWRQRLDREIATCFDEIPPGQDQRLCPRRLTNLLAEVPPAYSVAGEFCAFVQPLDGEGRAWVVNVIGEGYGRFSGRFTAGMDGETQERWASYFRPLSFLDFEGEPAEVIDMSCPGGRTIDVHVPQTHRVLKMPGDRSRLPKERVLRLRDLRVRLRGADQFPILTDSTGQRLLPVHLGSSAARRRPTILKFLAIFGPGKLPPQWPVKSRRLEAGVEMIDRHWSNSTVYLRRRWRTELQPWLDQVDTGSEARAFAGINAWRLARGIPDRVFALEPVSSSRQKPQYVDFSSPSFVQIFRTMLSSGTRALVLEEALPTPEQLPLHGSRWGVEVQLESFCFRHRSLCAPRGVRGALETARSAGII